MRLTSAKTILEMTQSQKPVRKISIATLAKWATLDALKQGGRKENIMLHPFQLFSAWMSKPHIVPYFRVGNVIGLDVAGALAIKASYIETFEAAQQHRIQGPI